MWVGRVRLSRRSTADLEPYGARNLHPLQASAVVGFLFVRERELGTWNKELGKGRKAEARKKEEGR